VHVVAHHRQVMEQVLGPEGGAFVRALHEANGVVFHLGETVGAVGSRTVTLKSGKALDADLVVVGIGVRPGVGLASWAGLALEGGAVAVDERLQTSAPGIFAAGDLVAWPDPRTGKRIRSEHWAVAQRQGQTAALNLLGQGRRFDDVPFFWTAHYDTTLRYVGHAERWDRIDVSGSLEGGDCAMAFRAPSADGAERTLAVVTLGRDRDALRAEAALERLDWDGLNALVPARQPAHG
jgi:NADPH-dependent 2,4-dienoyl-CoA reductase/sulfur reductase-like enzyme